MKQRFTLTLAFLAILLGMTTNAVAFTDIKADFTNQSFFTEADKDGATAGLKMNADGTFTRVAADDATANAVISGKYHSTDHGISNFSATVAVEGPVKITFGTCAWGGNVTVKNAAGAEVVNAFSTNTGACYHQNKEANVVVAYYSGDATTLTIAGGSYVPYFAVEKVNQEDIPHTAKLTFALGDSGAEGVVPAAIEKNIGEKVTIPANRTLWVADKTLTAWTDGTNQYKAGDEITLAENVNLTPIFTANEAAFADRTAEVTAIWDFQQKNGAPVLNYQNKTGFYVTQIVVNEKTIDFRLDFDTNNGGKIANGSWQDWCQINSGTKFVLPAYKGTTYSTFSMNENSNTTFNGETGTYANYENTYTFNGSSDEMTIDIQGGSYYRWVKAVYPVPTQDAGGFVDIKADFMNQSFFTAADKNGTTAGLKMNSDGTFTRVAADDATANAVISGKYHSDDHGISNFSATVKVEGTVKITFGTCAWGGDVTVKNAEGATVASMNTNTGACYHQNKEANVVSCYYKQDVATTLTISGGSYVPYFAVEKVDPKDVPSSVKFIFDASNSGAEGEAPAEETVSIGKQYTLPKNFTLYKKDNTLTGWTDGTNTYAPGETITAPDAESVTLTPVFTANEVSLADRTAEVTLNYIFRRDAGAPTVSYQNVTGIWVAQATIGDKVIDVKADFDTNNGGKFANGNWTDWAQLNQNTKWTIPSCKGATVSIEAYNELKTTSIDGQTDYTSGKTINYTVASAAETVDVVIGNDGSYYRYIKVVLPVVQSAGGEKFENVAGTITWAVGNEESAAASEEIAGAISGTSVSVGTDLTATSATYLSTQMIAYKPAKSNAGTVEGVMVEYRVKPKAGVTFKPTSVSYNAVKDGTDNATYSWSYTLNGVESSITEVSKDNIVRNNNTTGTPAMNHTENLSVDACSEFTFRIYVSGFGNSKKLGLGSIVINGVFDGTVQTVNQYTLTAVANPAEGGSINIYPAGGTYDEGTTLKLTATENFGYDFVNWTDATGTEVSKETVYSFDIAKDETLTANFKKVNTYELALTVDGTNDYMVTVSPEPTVVDGKNMYEEGAKVVLTANQYEGLVTFTNWSDNSTNSELNVTMDENKQITAYYSEADIIAGWDFYKAGGNGRKADFAAQDNEADALNLVETATGNTSGWLDKSTLAGGGYESFKGAAVNWRTGEKEGDVGNWHWQTKVNAEAFTDVNVQFQMLYNYNAYQTYDAEYSLDGENWTKFGSVTMEGAKAVASFDQKLPEAANNQKDLYIRMIADKTSEVKGSSSKNDGNTLAMFFITGTPKLVDDPVPPTLVSSVPENNATGASASGKIVLNFDKKVQVAEDTKGTLVITGGVGGQQLTPAVSGKVITLEYKDLDYAKSYTFTLPANSVKNLTGAALADAITIKFTTMERPTVTKAPYDAMVATVEELLDAINTANTRADQNTRFRIFIKKGTYNIPLKEDVLVTKAENYQVPECITFITGNNISFIGEDRDETIITNAIPADATFAGTYGTTSKYDGIGNSDVFQIASSVSGLYWQDLTVETGMEDGTGRDLAIQDKGTKNIYKNVALRGYQDTWTSNNNNGLYYFEGGYLRGRTDYMCGKGDIYFNEVELRQIQGGYAAVPSTPAKIGWVFKGCTINGEASPAVKDKDGNVIPAENVDGNYTLGRPWGKGTPTAYFIDTKMNVIPSAIGWSEMSGGFPKQFAEYNSTTKTGATIDLSGRKKTFDAYDKKEEVIDPVTGEKTVVYTNRRDEPNNPELTAAEAAEYSDMSKMFGDWNPQLQTEAAPVVSDVKLEGNTLSWTGNNYSLLYVICKDGDAIAFTDDTTFDLSTLPASAAGSRAATASVYSVRAANEMGGLSKAVVASDATGIQKVGTTEEAVKTEYFNLQGQRVTMLHRGVIIEVKTMADGSKQVTKRIVK